MNQETKERFWNTVKPYFDFDDRFDKDKIKNKIESFIEQEVERQWIDVREQMPKAENGEAVEVIINSHVENAKEKDVCVCGVFYKNNFYICAEWEGGFPEEMVPIEKGRITHWQSLPEPPAENHLNQAT